MKRKSIVSKSIVRLIILGAAILLSVIVVSAMQFYNQMTAEYKEVANAFFKMVSIEPSIVNDMLSEENQAAIIGNDVDYMLDENGYYKEPYLSIVNEWYRTDWFLYETVSFNKNFLTFQILIPDGNDAVCLWYEKKDDEEFKLPFYRRPLEEEEKNVIDALYTNDKRLEELEDDFIIGIDDGKITGTLIQPVRDENYNIIAIAELDVDLSNIMFGIIKLIIRVAILVIFIIGFSLELYFYFAKRELLTPIQRIVKATENVVDKLKNNEDIQHLDIRTNDEIETLSKSFEAMEENLRNYIAENNAITAEREHIKAELDLASNIQSDMLIKAFPAFPDRKEFNIYATMNPAKEVGGDFYDFFLIDDNHLALVIADVSGKGVPASLFMMRSMLTIEGLAASTISPGKILESLNNMVRENNESKMFVTVWLGILDIEKGLLKAANAGHEFPMIKKSGDEFELYKDKHSFIVGGMKNIKYKEYELQLEPGTCIFVYTDGVPEAKNENNEMFRIESTLEALNKDPNANVKTLLANVRNSVTDFVRDAEQFDDLTMLGFEYLGPEASDESSAPQEITVEATIDNINVVTDFISEQLKKADFKGKVINQIRLASEEILANIANYAYSDSDENKDMHAIFELENDGKKAKIVFKDNGTPFDPLAKEDPDTTLSAKEREIGGLGIFLTKKLMDTVSYEYKDNQNILTITKDK